MVLPALPDFIVDFKINYSTASWILASYMIAGAVMTPIAGKLADIYGKKKILLIVLSIYTAGLFAAGFANTIEFMIASRVAQGMGVAMFPIAFGIIREAFPPSRLAVGQSVFSSTFAGGAVVGLAVGAGIIQTYGWHATFFTIFPVAVILGLVITRLIKDSKIQVQYADRLASKSIDIRGAATLAFTIVSFLVGLSFLENSKEASDLTPVWFFAAASASLFLFIMAEKKTAFPLVDLKLLTHKVLLPSNIILMLVGLCTFMVYQTIPILVQSPTPLGFGGNESTTAAVQLPFMIIWLVGMSTSGFLVNRIGNKKLTAAGTIICTIGFFAIFAFHSSTFFTTVTLAIISIGLSFAFIGGFNVVLMSSPIQMTGISLGMTVLLNLIGQSVGPTIAGMYQQMHRDTVAGISGSFPSADAYNLIFLTAAMMSLASVGLALMLNKMKNTKTVMY
jgi:MFS family permease